MIIWNNDLGGSVNHNSPGLLANDQFELLVNISQQQSANIAHRLGSDLYLNSVSGSNPVRGLHMYEKNDGTNHFHMVHQGTLYVNGASTWSSQDASEWATSSEIDMANFVNRHYFASSAAGEYLRYAIDTGTVTIPEVYSATASASSTGSTLVVTTNVFSEFMVGWTITNVTDAATRTITAYTNSTTVTVSSAINDTWDGDALTVYLDGKYLAVNGGYMMISGNSTFPRRTFFSNVDSGLFSLATDFFITSTPPIGIASFGNGRTFIIFTKRSYMVADPAQPNYTTEVDGFGCVSHRSIANLKNGGLIYLGNDAFYYLTANTSNPVDTSKVITNALTGDALFNKIDKTNLSVTAAGTINDIYYCAVRDLSGTIRGETVESAVFVIDTSQNNWKVESYPTNDVGSVLSKFTNSSGDTNLYAGSFSSGTVYKMSTNGLYTDDNTAGSPQAVTSTVLTKHYEYINKTTGVSLPVLTRKLWFKYRSTSTVSVSKSLNGNTTYTALDTLPIYTTTSWDYSYIDLNEEARTISLKFTFTGECIIYAIGFAADYQSGQGIKGL